MEAVVAASSAYPGERLGLPEHGPRSVARPGRRIAAIAVDWAVALAVSAGFFAGNAWATLLVFAVMQLALVGTVGSSIGHRLLGLQVVRVDGAWAGPLRAAVRTALLCLAVAALVWNADQRGLHDQAAGTVLLRR